jgi:hypothetical protein
MASLHEVGKNALCGNKVCPPVFLLPVISDHTVCRIFMKFAIDILYRNLSSKFVFRENRPIVSHTLLQDVNPFLTVISIFPIISCTSYALEQS